MNNFLLIKFHKPGVVVWAPPMEVDSWTGPGEVLFIVHLSDGSGHYVQVQAPSFDIRFPHETVWYLRKTLTRRWRTLENRIKAQSEENESDFEQEQSFGGAKLPRAKEEGDSGKDGGKGTADASKASSAPARKKKRAKHDDEKELETSGAEPQVFVTEHAFVCRLRKRGSHLYDRQQTQNWYRAVLRKFQEVQEYPRHGAPEKDLAQVKTFVMNRFMNVREPLRAGENDHVAGLFKGHVSVNQIDEAAAKTSNENYSKGGGLFGKGGPKPSLPMDNLWISTEVHVDVYVLTLRGITPHRRHTGNLKLRPRLELDGIKQAENTEELQVPEGKSDANFYWHGFFNTTLPGASEFVISICDQDENGVQTLGTSRMDLEDRWLTLTQRQFQQSTSKEYLSQMGAPSAALILERPKPLGEKTWQDPSSPKVQELMKDNNGPEPVGDVPINPQTPPQPPLPIETRNLLFRDEATDLETTVGVLRYCIEMTPMGAMPAPKYSLGIPEEAFTITVTIWSVSNISVFRDSGQRNDVAVLGRLLVHDSKNQEVHFDRATDTHSWAHRDANFNYTWTFQVSAPVRACMLALKLVDKDAYTSDDLIYAPVVVPLDHMFHLAYKNKKMGRKPLGKNKEMVVFDEWPVDLPDEKKIPDSSRICPLFVCCFMCCRCIAYYLCCCLTCGLSKRFFKRHKGASARPAPSVLNINIEIMPQDLTSIPPESEQFQEPAGRIGWKTGLRNPLVLMVSACGQRNMMLFCNLCCVFLVVLIVVLTGLCIIFASNIKTIFN